MKKTVKFNSSGIGKLPENKPVIYRVETERRQRQRYRRREARPRSGARSRASARDLLPLNALDFG